MFEGVVTLVLTSCSGFLIAVLGLIKLCEHGVLLELETTLPSSLSARSIMDWSGVLKRSLPVDEFELSLFVLTTDISTAAALAPGKSESGLQSSSCCGLPLSVTKSLLVIIQVLHLNSYLFFFFISNTC